MPRLSSILVVVALAAAIPTLAFAAGAYVRKEPVQASVLPPLPSVPSVSASESFNGCGGRRIRDPKTGHCHGPGDLAH
jgi:hypothetical protein